MTLFRRPRDAFSPPRDASRDACRMDNRSHDHGEVLSVIPLLLSLASGRRRVSDLRGTGPPAQRCRVGRALLSGARVPGARRTARRHAARFLSSSRSPRAALAALVAQLFLGWGVVSGLAGVGRVAGAVCLLHSPPRSAPRGDPGRAGRGHRAAARRDPHRPVGAGSPGRPGAHRAARRCARSSPRSPATRA